jgi:hypothetical protein
MWLAGMLGLLLLAAGGCRATADDERFELRRVQAQWADGAVRAQVEQQLQLSAEARRALQHGVPLKLRLELQLRRAQGGALLGEASRSWEIRYLPLSERYQLTSLDDGRAQTWPRLRHALAELAQTAMELETGPLEANDYQVLARSRLDMSGLPAPMRLPALFDPEWRHASAWSAWPLQFAPET